MMAAVHSPANGVVAKAAIMKSLTMTALYTQEARIG